jgi:hypothetical protein
MIDWYSMNADGASENGDDSSRALEELLRRWEYRMRAHLMTRFHCQEQTAQDLIEKFIRDAFLKKRLFEKANPAKEYQFRACLLQALEDYARSEFRKQNATNRLRALPE